jgi:hypothetical protein
VILPAGTPSPGASHRDRSASTFRRFEEGREGVARWDRPRPSAASAFLCGALVGRFPGATAAEKAREALPDRQNPRVGGDAAIAFNPSDHHMAARAEPRSSDPTNSFRIELFAFRVEGRDDDAPVHVATVDP